MTLPSMPSPITSREALRIGGGYLAAAQGSSPAGGLDIDAAGNIAANGDLTLDGTLSASAIGPTQFTGTTDFLGGAGNGGSTINANGIFTDVRLTIGATPEATLSVVTGNTIAQLVLTTPSGNGGADLQLDARPEDESSVSYVSVFRNTTTTGSRMFRVLPGNGESTPTFEINAQNGTINFRGSMADSTKDPRSNAPADWVEIRIAGSTYFVPAYEA